MSSGEEEEEQPIDAFMTYRDPPTISDEKRGLTERMKRGWERERGTDAMLRLESGRFDRYSDSSRFRGERRGERGDPQPTTDS